jgi:hypothetical protein
MRTTGPADILTADDADALDEDDDDVDEDDEGVVGTATALAAVIWNPVMLFDLAGLFGNLISTAILRV